MTDTILVYFCCSRKWTLTLDHSFFVGNEALEFAKRQFLFREEVGCCHLYCYFPPFFLFLILPGLSLTFQVGGESKKVGGDKKLFFVTLIWCGGVGAEVQVLAFLGNKTFLKMH